MGKNDRSAAKLDRDWPLLSDREGESKEPGEPMLWALGVTERAKGGRGRSSVDTDRLPLASPPGIYASLLNVGIAGTASPLSLPLPVLKSALNAPEDFFKLKLPEAEALWSSF